MIKKADKKTYIIIFLLIVIVVQSVVFCKKRSEIIDKNFLITHNFKGNCIPDEETAIEYGKLIYKVRTGKEYTNDDFNVRYDENNKTWNVVLKKYDENNQPIVYVDYAGIFIYKEYGTIVADYIG